MYLFKWHTPDLLANKEKLTNIKKNGVADFTKHPSNLETGRTASQKLQIEMKFSILEKYVQSVLP